MTNLFEHTSAHWVRYSAYEWKKAADGELYLTAVRDATPAIYDPLKDGQTLVLDALNIGKMGMSQQPDIEIQKAIMQFAMRYGLLGLMTALPTTAGFMEYEAVYLPKNRFIKAETMRTEEYLSLFFPFAKPEVVKKEIESRWSVSNDRAMIALALTMQDKPMTVNMSFQREYAERYDWLKQQFTDWAFIFMTSILYYKDRDKADEDTLNLYRQSMAAFDGNAPSYHIALLDKPTIIWDFHSLLLGLQLMLSFMLMDEQKPLRMCKHCSKAFAANRPSTAFCSPRCKNQYNVYKSRAKEKKKR